MTTGNFSPYCGQSFAGLCLFTEARCKVQNQKKVSENFIEYFDHRKIGIAKGNGKFFQRF